MTWPSPAPRSALLRAAMILTAASLLGACSGSGGDPVAPDPHEGLDPATVVMVDRAHHNAHTLETTLRPFGQILREEGFEAISSGAPFRSDSLDRGFLLVISNALHASNVDDWRRPVLSAFDEEEIATVREWVDDGGSLLLIADHMPFPGAAADLADAFGITLADGFAFDPALIPEPSPCLVGEEIQLFRRSDGTLLAHPVTDGPSSVDSVATFTGHAFEPDLSLTPLLRFPAGAVQFLPDEAWVFTEETVRVDVGGWYQGAVKSFGRGRIAVFGEAAMFTEQTCDGDVPMGMNAPRATQNEALIRNLVRWLHGGS